MPSMAKKQVLIVDDQPGIVTTVTGILEDEGFTALSTESGEAAVSLYGERRPDVVLLDIWLPDRDGLETLKAIRELDPTAAVVMMSGHGTTSTAVRALKMGAADYIEKPLSYERVVEAVEEALRQRQGEAEGDAEGLEGRARRVEPERRLEPPPLLPVIQESARRQRTLKRNTVIYGLGLHSGTRTGMVLQPLPPDSGIHLLTIPRGTLIPAHVDLVADTDYATTLVKSGEGIRTVEHLLSALHAAGVTNLLIKVHGEIPVLDGSAREFCQTLQEVGLEVQDAPRKELVVDREVTLDLQDGKSFRIEPYDGFRISYRLRYPEPVGDQFFDFDLSSFQAYQKEIAPARTFGFMRDLPMMNQLGLGSGGRLDNFILVGEDNVVNTELRFPDEFVRHKILDIIGDLYLLGYPVRGRVHAELTGHRDNIAILRQLQRSA